MEEGKKSASEQWESLLLSTAEAIAATMNVFIPRESDSSDKRVADVFGNNEYVRAVGSSMALLSREARLLRQERRDG